MNHSKKNQALEAEYASKLKAHAALLKEISKIDEATNKFKQQIALQSAMLKHFNNSTIPKGKKLLNAAEVAHVSWLAGTERNDQNRIRLTAMLNTKMSKMEEEERQLKVNITERKIEEEQLQATIEELKESIVTMQPKVQETKFEIKKIKGLHFISEKRKAELEKIENGKKELLKAAKVNCIQGNDEIQLLKERYAEAKLEETASAAELKRMHNQRENLDAEQHQPRFMLEFWRKKMDEVTAEAEALEVNSKPALEKIKAENTDLLAEQQAQQLANDEVIADLTRQLRSVKADFANLERQNTVLRLKDELPITMRRVHSTPNSQVSSTSSTSPNLSPIFGDLQQQPAQTNQEIQQRFDNRNINERTVLRNLPSHLRSNAQNQ